MSWVEFGPRGADEPWVLAIAPVDDGHARTVARFVARHHRLRIVVWDASDFPATDMLTFRPSGPAAGLKIENQGAIGEFDRCVCIWWRRPGKFQIDEKVTDARIRDYCQAECTNLFKSALAATGVPIINDPFAELAARKPTQLHAAAIAGLAIPDTVMTNDPAQVQAFWDAHGGECIYKTFTPPSWRMAETRVLTGDHLKDLSSLRHAPIIVQQLVPKAFDVRATIIDGECFAGSVATGRPESQLDWRMDVGAVWTEHELPVAVADKLRVLMESLGLVYGAIDLRLRPDGEYVFFEVNPSGQYLFVETATGMPITKRLADVLLHPPSPGPRDGQSPQ
jgi:glutathione synthase/RimK-type ligase-like ATP-grasp enzyme